MKYIIEIPEEVKEKFDDATKDDIYGSYYDYNSVIGNAIKNSTPLPKGHGGDIKAFDAAIKALEQEPCEDAISRQAVLEGLASIAKAKAKSDAQKSLMGRCMFFVEQLPPVNPQEPKTGRWINQRVIYTNATIDLKVCSECRYEFSYDAETGVCDANYCPNCGARMESEDKE